MSMGRNWIGVGAAAVVVSGLIAQLALARPVRPGSYVEIPYGIDPAHPVPTGAASARRHGRVRIEGPREVPTRQWETTLRVGRPSSPAVSADGRLYIANQSGVVAVEPGGAIAWTLRLGFVSGTPSLTPTGELAVATHAGGVFLVSSLGEIRLRTLVAGAIRGSTLVLADGSIVVSAFDQATHRLDADGREMFRTPAPFQSTGPVALGDRGELWVPSGNTLQVLSPRGELLRAVATDALIAAGPAIADDGTVWVLGDDHVLRQIAPSGVLRSQTALGVPISSQVTLAVGSDGGVRVPTRADSLVCIGPGGAERWRVDGEGSFLGGVLIDSDDVTYALNQSGRLVAIDAQGQVLWGVDTGARTDTAPSMGPDGTLYVASATGVLSAWR